MNAEEWRSRFWLRVARFAAKRTNGYALRPWRTITDEECRRVGIGTTTTTTYTGSNVNVTWTQP